MNPVNISQWKMPYSGILYAIWFRQRHWLKIGHTGEPHKRLPIHGRNYGAFTILRIWKSENHWSLELSLKRTAQQHASRPLINAREEIFPVYDLRVALKDLDAWARLHALANIGPQLFWLPPPPKLALPPAKPEAKQ